MTGLQSFGANYPYEKPIFDHNFNTPTIVISLCSGDEHQGRARGDE